MVNKLRYLCLAFILVFMSGCAETAISVSDGVLRDENGESILEVNNALPVNVQDQTTPIVDLHLIHKHGEFNLTNNISIDDTVFNVTAGHNITTADMITLFQGDRWYQSEVQTVVGNTITVDTPFDYNFSTNAQGENGDWNLNHDGSTNVVLSSMGPCKLDGIEWDITRLMIVMITNGNPDGSKFGDITGGLTNGIVIRNKNGKQMNLFNAKSNGDLAAHSYDVSYDDRAGGSGFYQTTVRTTFAGQSKRGVVIRLNSTTCDELQILNQDDLSTITSLQAIIQGHQVQN